jgi:Flp pilus assembly protein TadD
LKKGNRKSEAIEQIEDRLVNNPDDTSLLNQLGLLFIETSEFEKAIHCFRRIIEINPAESIAHDNLGFVFEKMDQPENAAKVYVNALKTFPNDFVLLDNLRKSIDKILDPETQTKFKKELVAIENRKPLER